MASKREKLSPAAQALLDHYFHIKVGQFAVSCPYFMNVKRTKASSIVYSGKGLPMEIEQEVGRVLGSRIKHYKTPQDAKDFLVLCGLGIDCSGLVANVLNQHLLDTVGKSLFSLVRYTNPYSRFISYFRPRMYLWADMLTGPLNTSPVKLKDIRPGDLLRQGPRHVLLIEWVERNGSVSKIGYVESNARPEWGVQRGEIDIKDEDRPLEDQKWQVEMAALRYKGNSDKGIVRLN